MLHATYTTVRLRRPRTGARKRDRHEQQREANARIWEAARMAEKVNDNYCIPTPDGYEVRFSNKVQKITGAEAAQVRDTAALIAVDPCDWILYIYSINE